MWDLSVHPSCHPSGNLPSPLPPLPLLRFCIAGQLVDCAEGFTCSGADPGCAPVVQPAQPDGQPSIDPANADTGFTACSEDDNTCLADKTGYCLAGLVVACEDSTQCSGDAGQAACAPSNTTAPPSPPAPNCTESDFACINGEASYCLSQEQVDCPPGGWLAGWALGLVQGGN